MFLLPTSLVLTLAISCGVLGYPAKGGEKGHNVNLGQWAQPKDWDWSVTTGRLIPVSEATDDLPTPGYRMSDLQQKVMTGKSVVKSEESTVANTDTRADTHNRQTNNTATPGEEVVQNDNKIVDALPTESTTSGIPSTRPADEDTDRKELSSTTKSDKEEPKNIVTPIIRVQEKLPVVEETIKKVILPEICSISGIGCGDRRPHAEEKSTTIPSTSESAEKTQSTETLSTLSKVDEGEQETERNTPLSSSSTTPSSESTSVGTTYKEISTTHKIDNFVQENVDEQSQQTEKISTYFPIGSSTNVASTEISSTTEASSTTISSIASPQEQINVDSLTKIKEDEGQSIQAHIQKVDSFDSLQQQNLEESSPAKPYEEHIHTTFVEYQKPQSTQFDEEQKPLPTKLDIDQEPQSVQFEIDQKSLPTKLDIDQEPQTVQFEIDQKPLSTKFDRDQKPRDSSEESDSSEDSSEDQLQQKSSLHVVDKSSSESPEDKEKLHFEVHRRMDDGELTQEVEKQKTDPVVTERDVKEVSEEEHKLMKSQNIEQQQVTTENTKENPESLSFTDRITSYWRAATGYVSKALNI